MCIHFNFRKSLFLSPRPASGHVLIRRPLLPPGATDLSGSQRVSLLPPWSLPDFPTPRSGRTELGEEEGGGAPNTRTRTLTCSPAEGRKTGAERTAGAASPAGSERRAPGALPCAWAAALLVWGAPPRFPPQGRAAGRTMLLKEYRICMPLTVDEVSAAPGPASPAPGPQPQGAAYPAAASRSAGPLRAAGKPCWSITSQARRLEGRKEGSCCFHLSPQRGRAALGGAVDSRWSLGGSPRALIPGDPDAPKGIGAPLPPINKMNKANPGAPSVYW